MSRLYIEAAIAAVLFITGTVTGWHFGSLHWKGQYQTLVASQDAASAKAANDAAIRIQTQRATYDAQLQAITDSYHRETAAADATADDLAQQLRDYSSRLSRCRVPASAGPPVRADDPAQEPAGDSRITNALARVVQAAGDDAQQLIALQKERASLK